MLTVEDRKHIGSMIRQNIQLLLTDRGCFQVTSLVFINLPILALVCACGLFCSNFSVDRGHCAVYMSYLVVVLRATRGRANIPEKSDFRTTPGPDK